MIPRRLLPDLITYLPQDGDGPYGPTYGDPVTVRARVSFQRRLVRDAAGAEVVASATIYCQPGQAPRLGDRVIMPDGYEHPVINEAQNKGRAKVELVTLDVG